MFKPNFDLIVIGAGSGLNVSSSVAEIIQKSRLFGINSKIFSID